MKRLLTTFLLCLLATFSFALDANDVFVKNGKILVKGSGAFGKSNGYWYDTSAPIALWEMNLESTNPVYTSTIYALETSKYASGPNLGYNAFLWPTNSNHPVQIITGTNIFGRVERGYRLDNTGANKGLVYGDEDAFSFGDGTTDRPFSVAMWVYRRDSGSMQHWVFYKGVGYEYSIWTSGTSWIFDLKDRTLGGGRGRSTPLGTSSASSWRHLVCTYDGRGGTSANLGIKIYVNNVRRDNANFNSGTYLAMTNTTQPLITGNAYSTGKLILSDIGEIALYNYELSVDQIAELYENTHPTNNLRFRVVPNMFPASTNTPTTDGLLAYYAMNESGGIVDDEWTNSYDLTVSGTVGFDTAYGVRGDGAYFNNATANRLQRSPFLGAPPYTFSVWAKRTGATDFDGLYADYNAALSGGTSWIIYDTHKQSILGKDTWYYSTATVATTGVWYHLSCSVNTNKEIIMYINGTPDSTQTAVNVSSAPAYPTMFIGSMRDGANPFNGYLDEFRFYNRILTDDEVMTLYNWDKTGAGL